MEKLRRATPDEIEPVLRREGRRVSLTPIDWTMVIDGEWWTVYRARVDESRAERLREFERVRKSATRWAGRHDRVAEVRREGGSVFVRMVAPQ